MPRFMSQKHWWGVSPVWTCAPLPWDYGTALDLVQGALGTNINIREGLGLVSFSFFFFFLPCGYSFTGESNSQRAAVGQPLLLGSGRSCSLGAPLELSTPKVDNYLGEDIL